MIKTFQEGIPMSFKWDDVIHMYCCDCGMAHRHYYEPTLDGYSLMMLPYNRGTAARRRHHDTLNLKHGVGKWQMTRIDSPDLSAVAGSL